MLYISWMLGATVLFKIRISGDPDCQVIQTTADWRDRNHWSDMALRMEMTLD